MILAPHHEDEEPRTARSEEEDAGAGGQAASGDHGQTRRPLKIQQGSYQRNNPNPEILLHLKKLQNNPTVANPVILATLKRKSSK